MKKRFCIVLILALCFSICSCKKNTSEDSKLHVCASYSLPGMFAPDIKGDYVDVLETDLKGRTLFRYTAYNYIYETKHTVFVICQAYDSDYVYFYEDNNYIDATSSTEAIECFKELNDWNEELDYSKMSKRRIEISFDLFIIRNDGLSASRVRDSVKKHFEDDSIQIESLSFEDVDQSGKELYFLILNDNGVERKFLVIVNGLYELAFLEIYESRFDSAAFESFKMLSGWEY